MLPARARMRRAPQFAAAVRRGRRGAAGVVVVHLATQAAGTGTSVGFVVARSVGSAVTRNRVRRRLRELVRERLAALPPDSAVVVRAHPSAVGASYERLGRDLDAALARAAARGVTRS